MEKFCFLEKIFATRCLDCLFSHKDYRQSNQKRIANQCRTCTEHSKIDLFSHKIRIAIFVNFSRPLFCLIKVFSFIQFSVVWSSYNQDVLRCDNKYKVLNDLDRLYIARGLTFIFTSSIQFWWNECAKSWLEGLDLLVSEEFFTICQNWIESLSLISP